MKKLVLATSAALILGATGVQAAENTAAALNVTKNVVQKCNIGLLAGSNDGSVGSQITALSSNAYTTSELNDLNVSGQTITGAVACNARGGFKVSVEANGALSNGAQSIPYILETKPGGYSATGWTSGSGARTIVDGTGTPTIASVGVAATLDEIKFQLNMKPTDPAAFDNAFAGVYTETIRFVLTPIQ